ncbi:leucine-rich repeat domain-containing protein [Nannocystis sp. SCPEA4]|uniref:leucine-rich repeat domain-containing protein n=1 Tax=Nannocystis sp. SCPEA4 TaxID=2996787 RepID=UPI00226E6F4F|nr:leucine-rich repeat domain-containing protein [Nannocystis sp. SCPEA4]MCY1055632.1 hypothetical protein [Nannocystis sp. SCPEA4]
METRLLRVTDEGTEECVCRLEGDELVMTLSLPGRRPYTTRKRFGSDDPERYSPPAEWHYPPLVARKLGEGFVFFGDGAAGLYAPLFRAVGGTTTFDLHPESHAIAYATLRSEAYGADIHVLDLRTGRSRVVHGVEVDHAAPNQTWIRDVRYHPGGDALYFTLNAGAFKLDLAPARRRVVARAQGKLVARNQAQFLCGNEGGEARLDMDPARRFVVVCTPALVRVLSTDDERELLAQPVWGPEFAEHRTAAISPSGRLLAVASARGTIRVFDVATRREVDRMTLDRDVRRIGFTPGEKELLVAHEWRDDGPTVYAIGQRRERFQFTDEDGAPRSTPSWSFAPDGKTVALAGRALTVCAAGTWRTIERLPGDVGRVVFSRDGRLLVAGGRGFAVYKATAAAIPWPVPAVTPPPSDCPEVRGFDVKALLREWDGLHESGAFPCGEGYFGDKFDHWDARLEVYAAHDGEEPRYLVVFQVIGADHTTGDFGNSIFVIGDRPDWPERDMLDAATITSPQQTRVTQDYTLSDARACEEDARYVTEPQDPDGDWARLQKFRVCLDETEYPLEPSFADYVRAGVALTERQYAADLTASMTTVAKMANHLLQDRIWIADPLRHPGLAHHFSGARFTRVYFEEGVDVVAHVARGGPPSRLQRWQKIARLLAEGAGSEVHADMDRVEAAVRREYFPDKPGDEPLTAAECAVVVGVTLHDDLRATDLSFLARLPNVRRLLLFRTQVSELGALAKLPQLEELNLAGCPVADLSPLVSCRRLRHLTLSHTRVHDLRPLAALDGLQSLDLEGTSVRDLEPLGAHRGLRELFLDGTEVEDLAPLRGLGLVRLFMRDTGVADLSPLSRMQSLRVLTLPAAATNIDVLRELPIYEELRAHYQAGEGAMASKYGRATLPPMGTDERSRAVLVATLEATLKRLLPVTHGDFTLDLAEGSDGPVSTEWTYEDADTGTVRTARGVWILLNAITHDEAGQVVDVGQQLVHIAHEPDGDLARLVAFLEGWCAALPTLMERYLVPASPWLPFELLDASLCVATARTAEEFESVLKDPNGPMREWALVVQQMRFDREDPP